jgi:hypothetical protein
MSLPAEVKRGEQTALRKLLLNFRELLRTDDRDP